MSKKAKAELKETVIKARAQRIAEAVVRHRLREEALSEEEKNDLLKAVYEDQLKRLRAENK